MFRIIALLVALPLLVAATCADPKYPIATWQTVQDARQREAVMPLEWDSSLFPSVAERGQSFAGKGTWDGSFSYYPPSVRIYPWGQSGHLCEISGRIPPRGENSPEFQDAYRLGWNWVADYTARKCLLDPQYRHAAIAAYSVGPNGAVYELMWLTD